MEQKLFSTADIAAELEHKSTNPRRDVLNIAERLGFTPVGEQVRDGYQGGKKAKLWSQEQRDAILADNKKRFNKHSDANIQTQLFVTDTAEVTATTDNVSGTAEDNELIAPPANVGTFEPAPVVVTLDDRANRIRQLTANVTHGIIQIGFELIAAKTEVGHGNWNNWLEKEFSWTQRTANNFMRIADRFGKLENVFQFQPSQLQAMLALPEGDENEFIAVQADAGTPAEKQSVRDLQKSVKAFKAEKAVVAEEPTPDLSNTGEIFSIFGRDADQVTNDDRQDVTTTPAQINVVRELVTATDDRNELKAIRNSLSDLLKEIDAKIAQKK